VIAYKVVSQDYRSTTARGRYQRYYKPFGKLVFAESGSVGVFCFADLENAVAWHSPCEKILLVSGYNQQETETIAIAHHSISEAEIDSFYSRKAPGVPLASGIVLFQAVKPLAEIDIEVYEREGRIITLTGEEVRNYESIQSSRPSPGEYVGRA